MIYLGVKQGGINVYYIYSGDTYIGWVTKDQFEMIDFLKEIPDVRLEDELI